MGFKNLKKKYNLIKISLEHNFKIDTAYWFENLSSTFFVIVFSILTLVFNEIIFTTTDTIGTYDKNMMRFFWTISSFNFFMFAYILMPSMDTMISDINTGQFDYNLIRPVPSLFYTLTKRIQWFTAFRDGVAQSLVIAISVNWGALSLSFSSVIIGFLIWLIGQYLLQFVIFLFAITAFKTGEATAMLDIIWALDYRINRTIPFDPLPTAFKAGLLFILPTLYTTGVTVSVMLNESEPLLMLGITVTVAAVAFVIQQLLWKRCLANYTSASS